MPARMHWRAQRSTAPTAPPARGQAARDRTRGSRATTFAAHRRGEARDRCSRGTIARRWRWRRRPTDLPQAIERFSPSRRDTAIRQRCAPAASSRHDLSSVHRAANDRQAEQVDERQQRHIRDGAHARCRAERRFDAPRAVGETPAPRRRRSRSTPGKRRKDIPDERGGEQPAAYTPGIIAG